MAKSRKEKKQARRVRQEQLRATAEQVQEKLLTSALEPQEEVEYVLAEDDPSTVAAAPSEEEEAQHKNQPGSSAADEEAAEEEDDRVELPSSAAGAAGASALRKARKSHSGGGRKRHRMTWQALKLAVTDRFGAAAAELVSEHDGNAEDPFFTVLMKMQPHTVPVPRHWDRLRAFMSLQADREEAVGLIPAEIQALGVEKIRAAKDKRVNPDQIAFMTCFMTGTPLQRKTFHVALTPFGDVFREGKWIPKAHFEPGRLSQRLRQALGMGVHAPPPWLYSMQTMRRLPPAYPQLRVPGLNAPIPAGAQWGRGQGQWGDPPRGENNNFLFPGLMDESAASAAKAPRLWGVVPPLMAEEAGGAKASRPPPSQQPQPQQPQPQQPAATPTPTAASKVTITPAPFRPQAYRPQAPVTARYVASTPQEYVRVQDSAVGATVTVGHKMVRKAAVAPVSSAPQPQPQPQYPPPPAGKQPPVQQSAKQPAPPNPRANRGTKF